MIESRTAWFVLAVIFAFVTIAVGAPTGTAAPTQPAAPPVTSPTPGAVATGVSITLTEITPILTPQQDLSLRVVVTNNTPAPLTDAAVDVRLQRSQLISRSSVEYWQEREDLSALAAGQDRTAGSVIETVQLPEIAANSQLVVDVEVAAHRLGLTRIASRWGPRGVAVDVRDSAGILGRERTFLLWFPANPDTVRPTRASVLAPLTGTPPALSQPLPPDEPAPETRFDRIASATAGYEVAWAVDPDLAGSFPNQIAALRNVVGNRDVFALPAGDADIAALAHVAPTWVGSYVDGASAAVAAQLSTTVGDVLVFPAGPPDQDLVATAAEFSAPGIGALVLADYDVPPNPVLTYTPTGRARVTADNGKKIEALISDTALSQTLAAATADDSAVSVVTARQRLLADLAVITQERPTDPRHVLVTLPADWDPDPQRTRALLRAETAPWVAMSPVSGLLSTAVPDIDRSELPLRLISPGELPLSQVSQISDTRADFAVLTQIVPRAEELAGDVPAVLNDLTSARWRQEPEERARIVQSTAKEVADLLRGVVVLPSGSINLISDSGDIPVSVRNGLAQEATVVVRLTSNSSFLIADTPVKTTIPAGGESIVHIPVEAIGNRDVPVVITLQTVAGEAVGDTETFTVRVRAGWEDTGTRIIGVLLAVLLVVGLIRTVRRGRRRSVVGDPAQEVDPAQGVTADEPGQEVTADEPAQDASVDDQPQEMSDQ